MRRLMGRHQTADNVAHEGASALHLLLHGEVVSLGGRAVLHESASNLHDGHGRTGFTKGSRVNLVVQLSMTHSHTLPAMLYRPNLFGGYASTCAQRSITRVRGAP